MIFKSLKRFRLNSSEKSKPKERQKSEIEKAIEKALRLKVPFIAYSLPTQSEQCFYANPSDKSDGYRAFTISKWVNNVFATIYAEMDAKTFLSAEVAENTHASFPVLPASTSYLHYIDSVGRIIDSLNPGEKCVYSRVDSFNYPFFDMATAMAEATVNAFNTYPETAVYAFYTPQTGAWLAATPEVLLKIDTSTNRFYTIALAGTRDASIIGDWDKKNIEEQQIVSSVIQETLSSFGITYHISGPETLTAGTNSHIATMLTGIVHPDKTEGLVNALHPTPAIAGYPRNKAIGLISAYERHERGCYSGTVDFSEPYSRDIYVTLRCAQFTPQGYALYAGGGITRRSDPHEEWIETTKKMTTMASVIPQQHL